MPSGKIHYDIWKKWLKVALLFSIFAGVLTQDIIFGVSCALGYCLGRYVDPDLDLLGLSQAEGRLMRELKIIGVIITAWFLPYAYFMRFVGIGRKGHRNFFSHFPFISTLIRLVWLLAPFAVLGWYMKITYQEWWWVVLAGVFLFLGFADTLHFLADTFEGQRRKLWKRILL